jgi:hypothetical protein
MVRQSSTPLVLSSRDEAACNIAALGDRLFHSEEQESGPAGTGDLATNSRETGIRLALVHIPGSSGTNLIDLAFPGPDQLVRVLPSAVACE